MKIEPVFYAYWSDEADEMIETSDLIGYRVVSNTGAILGFGETRSEAVSLAQEALYL